MLILDIGHWIGKSESEVLDLTLPELRRWALHIRMGKDG